MLGVVAFPCHNLRFSYKKNLQQEGKEEQILEKAEVTHQVTKKCQSHATNPYFISHLVPTIYNTTPPYYLLKLSPMATIIYWGSYNPNMLFFLGCYCCFVFLLSLPWIQAHTCVDSQLQ
jgi:hypothetical protein